MQRFPDAMSKTIPIWAAVLNRAVLRWRQQAARQPPGGAQAEAEAEPAAEAEAAASWDCDVHLPAWVSENEAHNVRLRLDGWVEKVSSAALTLEDEAVGVMAPAS